MRTSTTVSMQIPRSSGPVKGSKTSTAPGTGEGTAEAEALRAAARRSLRSSARSWALPARSSGEVLQDWRN